MLFHFSLGDSHEEIVPTGTAPTETTLITKTKTAGHHRSSTNDLKVWQRTSETVIANVAMNATATTEEGRRLWIRDRLLWPILVLRLPRKLIDPLTVTTIVVVSETEMTEAVITGTTIGAHLRFKILDLPQLQKRMVQETEREVSVIVTSEGRRL